jgi:hypothetical protein
MQVAITAVLTLWADRVDWLLVDSKRIPGPFVHVVLKLRLIWRGVNAPTCPLCLAGSSNHSILGFSAGELLYLAAVASLWYLVGRFLDRRRGLRPPQLNNNSASTRFRQLADDSIALVGARNLKRDHNPGFCSHPVPKSRSEKKAISA